jgi:hypothetical protein
MVSYDQSKFEKAKSGSQDDVIDDAINSRLTKRLLENAIKDNGQLPQPTLQGATGIRGLFLRPLTFIGLAGLAVVLFLFSFFDRKEKVL